MSKEAMKLALEALELVTWTNNPPVNKAITAVREALADHIEHHLEMVEEQPAQQEPVALKWQQAPIRTAWGDDMVVASVAIDNDHTLSLYCERDQTARVDEMFAQPAQRTWVGLTDDELADLWYKQSLDWMEFARAIEAAHGIKENT